MVAISCGRTPEQRLAEYRSIQHARDLVQMHSLLYSNQLPTNLQQVYEGHFDRPYPYGWHKDFKNYGKHAGFKTSFFEKYVFFPPGSTSQIARGELVMMNSHPFPIAKRKLGRFVVLKQGASFSHTEFDEDLIQKMLKEERIKPYDLPAFPPPPPEPPRMRFPGEPPEWVYQMNLFFDRVSEGIGLGSRHGWILRNVSAGILVFIGLSAVWFLWRQARQHRRPQADSHPRPPA